MNRGLFIVFEGCDNSGKTTQINMLLNKLNNENIVVKQMSFPNRKTEIGSLLNLHLNKTKILSPKVSHLLFSANRWEMEQEIKEELNSGTTLIVDRYSYSGIAYSCANNLDFKWCSNTENGLPEPDIIFFLNSTTSLVTKRNGFGKEFYETEKFQSNVCKTYKKLFNKKFLILDASKTREEISCLIFKIVQNQLIRNKGKIKAINY